MILSIYDQRKADEAARLRQVRAKLNRCRKLARIARRITRKAHA